MENPGWVLQVYEMTDVAAQQAVAELLSGNGAVAVDMRTCERGAFLVLELADPADALSVYEMVMMTDPNAELIHTTTGPSAVAAGSTPV
jgi:hypothetical protein